MSEKKGEVTQFQDGVFVDPRVAPQAAAYGAGVLARRGRLQKTESPVAGGPMPPMPRLDTKPQEGLTMSQHAVFSGTPRAGAPVKIQTDILPTDLLPELAAHDPLFKQGQGAMYASSQPHLALKYGVIRNGQFIPAQVLGPPRTQLRPETVKDLETFNKLQATHQENIGNLPSSDEAVEQSMRGSAAEAAARAGNLPGDDSEAPVTEDEKKNIAAALQSADEFDLDSFRQAMMRDILNNPDQKEIVEKRLKELTIDELLINNRATQVVPIVPNRFEPTFQSMTAEEDLALKRLIMHENKGVDVSDRYLLDKYSFMSIAVGLKAINGKPFGEVTDEKGNFSDDLFWIKFNRIVKLPLHMLASIGIHLFWFEMRVRKLFVAEKVGNG